MWMRRVWPAVLVLTGLAVTSAVFTAYIVGVMLLVSLIASSC
jgi:hypothetical protein